MTFWTAATLAFVVSMLAGLLGWLLLSIALEEPNGR